MISANCRIEEEREMAKLSTIEKDRISETLDSTRFTQHGFSIKYDDENNPVAIITFSSHPDFRFVVHFAGNGTFSTSECPGIHSDEAETFQRNNFELCIIAVREWVKRIIDREGDWILDEFGGVADRTPRYN